MKYPLALARKDYLNTLENLRGRLKSCNLKFMEAERKRILESKTILGTTVLDSKKGISAFKTIKGDNHIDCLSLSIVEKLAIYIHCMLQNNSATHFKSDTKCDGLDDASLSGGRKHIVVGLSGGADSTLALVLAQKMRELYGYEVEAVHCIHKLDPDDDIWLLNNQKLCESLEIKLTTPELNIRYDLGFSPEEISRDERYRTLCGYLNDKSVLFMGHQADDMVESLILALKRGSGPQGLKGMQYLTLDKRGLIARPLLDLHKIEVEQILASLQVPTVFDLSNSYTKFERNFVRLRVLPLLRERFVGIDDAILRSQELLSIEHDLAERYISNTLPSFIKLDQRLNLKYFDYSKLDLNDRSLSVMLLRAFFNEVLGETVEYAIVEALYDLMLSQNDANGKLTLLVGDQSYIATTFKQRAYIIDKELYEGEAPSSGSMSLDFCISPSSRSINNSNMGKCHNESHNEGFKESSMESFVLHCNKRGELNMLQLTGILIGQYQSAGYCYKAYAPYDNGKMLYEAIMRAEDGDELHTDSVEGCASSESKLEFKLDSISSMVMLIDSDTSELKLNFDYANSTKLKPRSRSLKRELKKLFLEYEVPSFMRKLYPLVSATEDANEAENCRRPMSNTLEAAVPMKEERVLGMASLFASGKDLVAELEEQQDKLNSLIPIVIVGSRCKDNMAF